MSTEPPQVLNGPTFVGVFSKKGPAQCVLRLLSKKRKASVILLSICKPLYNRVKEAPEKGAETSVPLELVNHVDGTDCFNLVLWFLHLPTPPDPEHVLCACAALGRDDFIVYLSQNFPGYSVDPVSDALCRTSDEQWEDFRRTSNILAVIKGAVVGGQNRLVSLFKSHLPGVKYIKLDEKFWRLGIENGFLIESFASDGNLINGNQLLDDIQALQHVPLKDLETVIREVPRDDSGMSFFAQVGVRCARNVATRKTTRVERKNGNFGHATGVQTPTETQRGENTGTGIAAPTGIRSGGWSGASIGGPAMGGSSDAEAGSVRERRKLEIPPLGPTEEITPVHRNAERRVPTQPQQKEGGRSRRGLVSLFFASDDLISALALKGQKERVVDFIRTKLLGSPREVARAVDRFMAAAILGGRSELAKEILEISRNQVLMTLGVDSAAFAHELSENRHEGTSSSNGIPLAPTFFVRPKIEFAKCAAAMTGQTDLLKWMRSLDPPFKWSLNMCEMAARHEETFRWMMKEADPLCPPLSNSKPSLRKVVRSVIKRGDIPMMALLDELYPGVLQSEGACQEAAAAHQWDALAWLLTKSPPCTWNQKENVGQEFSNNPETPECLKLFEVEFRKQIVSDGRTAALPPPPPELQPALQKHIRACFVGLTSIFSGMKALEFRDCDWRLFSWLVEVGGKEELVEILKKGKWMEGDPDNEVRRGTRKGCLGFLTALSWHVGMRSVGDLISDKSPMQLKTFRKYRQEFNRLLYGFISLHSWCKDQRLPFWPEDEYNFEQCIIEMKSLVEMKEASPLLPILEEAKAQRGFQ
uniref:Uncharacterized protein n=1 Tax=Chromera velia CCMP2878 TaxID=1169474 RepID=A0A0G4HE25_9ALVE|eukprot:Cvel_26631.t1-p1 / transcript=Cvel_26631.t1 / gene=Cvel_26631 / organism=Chromera_velia_CCMP2878 / gene_product=hypothetical protein / transcript_product=hypothetical protein / location=Cvel_scaffold3199:15914-18352(-) / protein_length=813 / sequence_SO=supercontig / SO=protein_coding / is_pseudo=false